MYVLFKTGLRAVFKNNYIMWIVLAVLMVAGTAFLQYTLTFYRYLAYDCSLESADFCYTVVKNDMTLADLPAINDAALKCCDKDDFVLLAYYGEDSFGNPVYLMPEYYHNSVFRDFGNAAAVSPENSYEKGDSVAGMPKALTVGKTLETDIVQIDVSSLPQNTSVERVAIRFYRPLTGEECDALNAVFAADGSDGYLTIGTPARKPSLKGESFIVLNVAFFALTVVVVSFAVYWINIKSRTYYKTLYLLGYGRAERYLPMTCICFIAALLLSATGTALFYLLFCMSDNVFFIGPFYLADYPLTAIAEISMVAVAALIGQSKAVTSYA